MTIKNQVIALFVMCFLLFSATKVSANDFSSNTSDALINQAIVLTKSINISVVRVLQGDNSTGQPVRVKFANLSVISPDYMNADAVTIIGNDGRMTIYIDKVLSNSPPEAIACLLEHETTHNDAKSSIEEEVVAWTKEATTWNYFTRKNPSLAKLDETQYQLINRLNYLSDLYKEAGNTSVEIRKEILSNGMYTDLAMHSDKY